MLIVTDLHFTDKEADRYRWKIFAWIHDYYLRSGDKNILILGDLTDSKDHHSAKLVNAIVQRLTDLTSKGMEFFILMGNHDYIDPANPFFGFLNKLEYINFITEPRCTLIEGQKCLFLPHTRNPIKDWKANKIVEKYRKKADYVFMHESVIGSVTSSGYEMETGLLPSYFRRFKGMVISGDIHCPQKIGLVTYVGTPYSIRFNDHYRGRAMTVRGNVVCSDLYPDIRGRWTFEIDDPQQLRTTQANPGDQLKIRYRLAEGDEAEWDLIRKEIYKVAEAEGLEVCSLQVTRPEKLPIRGKKNRNALREAYDVLIPSKVVHGFSKSKGLSKGQTKAGKRIVDNG